MSVSRCVDATNLSKHCDVVLDSYVRHQDYRTLLIAII